MDVKKISDDILEEISRKLDAIIDRLNLLERIFLEDPRYESLAEPFRLTRIFLNLYGEPLKVLSRLRLAESYIKRESIQRDEIARCIIQVLAMRGPMNISAITREVKTMRGKASRRIIRERLKMLEKEGVVLKIEGRGKTRTYGLVEDMEKKMG